MKCLINSDNEVLAIWVDDDKAPAGTVPCDRLPASTVIADGPMGEAVNHYTLVSGKLVETAAGIAYNEKKYARDRREEYPSTGDQLDMMYKDTKNSTTTHADAVEVVKTKWPKDNSGPVE